VADAIREQRVRKAGDLPCTTNDWLNRHFGMHGCLILPLIWGTSPVGVLLVDVQEQEEDESRLRSLEAIAQQSASVLGMMSTRLRRARERAIREERARIARDIHDTVSQSLFGLVYTLDGCLKLLDSDPAALETELRWALRAAEETRQELRQTILAMWPEEDVTPETFEADLRHYAADVLQAAALHLLFDVRGDFSSLSARARRSLYRICQEALTNVAHHAAATEASICLDVGGGRARLVIRDNGRGFEPHVAFAQTVDETRFGLRGIQARSRSLGGTCDIFSRPGTGTSLVVDIPAAA
jgi:signal transduction histidine kinase